MVPQVRGSRYYRRFLRDLIFSLDTQLFNTCFTPNLHFVLRLFYVKHLLNNNFSSSFLFFLGKITGRKIFSATSIPHTKLKKITEKNPSSSIILSSSHNFLLRYSREK